MFQHLSPLIRIYVHHEGIPFPNVLVEVNVLEINSFASVSLISGQAEALNCHLRPDLQIIQSTKQAPELGNQLDT